MMSGFQPTPYDLWLRRLLADNTLNDETVSAGGAFRPIIEHLNALKTAGAMLDSDMTDDFSVRIGGSSPW
jgi:hypothetical protein